MSETLRHFTASLPDGTYECAECGCPAATPSLDVERLARALLRAVPGYQRWLTFPAQTGSAARGQVEAAESEARVHAQIIAKAYADDTTEAP
jgi:hypothetical protein